MEGLNAMLKLDDDRRLLRVLHPRIKESVFMYVDVIVIFLSPKQQDLVESASRPLVGFGELNDTTIKELIILLSI
jgi:hypothetical protein